MNELSKRYGTFERQTELLAMIKDIDQMFQEHQIKYSLCAGTLLGSVRENGFIPWDDDVDIMVDRANYNKITKLFANIAQGGTAYILKHNLWIDRIQRRDDIRDGLYAATIDIFTVDNSPDNVVLRRIKVLTLKMLQGMIKEKQEYSNQPLPYKICLWSTHILGKLFSAEKKFNWYQRVSTIGNNHKSQYVSCFGDLFKYMELRYPWDLMNRLEYRKFEDTFLPITVKYDSYLCAVYGDYMVPPDEKDRIAIHTL